jgi:hypothetical protein
VRLKKEEQVPKIRISGSPDNAESRTQLRTLIEFWRHLARQKQKEKNDDNTKQHYSNIPKA